MGSHQHDNMATAVATCARLRMDGWEISDGAIASGLQAAHMPGRLQVIQAPRPPDAVGGRIAALGTNPPWVVLDGAHSPEAASSLASTLRHAFPHAPIALIVAMASDKEHREVMAGLRHLEPSAIVFTAVPVAGSYQRAASPGGFECVRCVWGGCITKGCGRVRFARGIFATVAPNNTASRIHVSSSLISNLRGYAVGCIRSKTMMGMVSKTWRDGVVASCKLQACATTVCMCPQVVWLLNGMQLASWSLLSRRIQNVLHGAES